ncbi:aluminum-activated malate transporter 2-like [Syzygium oleosum]|uniref:aluminum-activated malate transporter 2-like n=1 Tax=Syzygium oleosum TaxID=219896 RepID=UPI0011D1FD09|nr:aluminum-activated malate transporter 2-like [Syzygium oleosum]
MIFIAMKAKELVQDHPRKIIHSLKVGLAPTLVSLFYYFRPLYDGFGINTIWALLTVVVVFKFSVGATLGKGLNRMLATSVTAALGIGAHKVAIRSGTTTEPILLAFSVFIIAALVTFTRFPPEMKPRHNYGLIMFDLTFCLVSVSGYQENQAITMAFQRVSTVVLGSCTAIIVCICICPIWSSEQLQDLIATNMDKLGFFLEGFGDKYFRLSDNVRCEEDGRLLAYRTVLTSKDKEEMLVIKRVVYLCFRTQILGQSDSISLEANFARSEPCHGQFRFRHPWEHHVKIGTLTRQCAFKIEVLDSCLHSDTQVPANVPRKIQEPCVEICVWSGNCLKEIASAIQKMTRPSTLVGIHLANAKAASEELKSLLKSGWWEGADLFEIIPAISIILLLIDVAECLPKIFEAVDELASLACFKCTEPGALRSLGR